MYLTISALSFITTSSSAVSNGEPAARQSPCRPLNSKEPGCCGLLPTTVAFSDEAGASVSEVSLSRDA
jgi:hypothetical protein